MSKPKTQKITSKIVAVNEAGHRIGETHQRAKISDHDLGLLLRLHDEGWGSRRLSAKFDIPRRTVRDYLRGRIRAQAPARWKLVPSTPPKR